MIHVEKSIQKLKKILGEMADQVEEMVGYIEKSIEEEEITKFDPIFEKDRKLDALEKEMDKEAVGLFATVQPMATDLRFVFSVVKLNVDLERIGDECKNVAKELSKGDLPLPKELKTMAYKVRDMVQIAFDAMLNQNPELARKIILMDDDVDKLEYEIIGKYSSKIRIAFAAKALERIADHTTNIAENVVYVTEGIDIRHENSIMNRLDKNDD